MKLPRMLGFLVTALTVAMALIGASTATAEYTQLCTIHKEPCPEGWALQTLHAELTPGTIWLMENNSLGGPEIDILCLKVLLNGELLGLGRPQNMSVGALTFSQCGTEGAGGSHSNCTVESTATATFPIHMDILKLKLNLGEIEALDGAIISKCVRFGFIVLECEDLLEGTVYHFTGATAEDHGMINTEGTFFNGGGGLCPEEGEITSGLLEPLKDVYIVE